MCGGEPVGLCSVCPVTIRIWRKFLRRRRCFLRVDVLLVGVELSQRRGGREQWPLYRRCCGKMRSRNAGGITCVSGFILFRCMAFVGQTRVSLVRMKRSF